MYGREYLVGAFLGLAAFSGCARERTELPATRPPSATERAVESRERIQSELSALSRDREKEVAKGELQSRVLDTQSRIATLSADLQSAQANAAAERGIVESQTQKEMALRQDQMRDIAASIRTNDEILAVRERELRFNLGPTGESYEGDENLNSLKREVERLRARGIELRSGYAALADENRSAIQQSASTQQSLVNRVQQRQSDLAASITEAQSELSRLEEQSKQLDAEAAARKQRADQLRSELAKLGG